MEAVNANDNSLEAQQARTSNERIATLEERSQHAATKAEMQRLLMIMFIALLTLLGGLIVHLHNTTLSEISEMRQLLLNIIQQMPGG